jgi:hypothetical protein
MMNKDVRNRYLLILTGVVAAVTVAGSTVWEGDRYVSVNPSVSQKFTAIPDEHTLQDLCYRLQSVQGVTAVSYRDYSPEIGTAVVTVFYNPRQTSMRQLRIFIQHSRILWEKPSST